MMQGEKELRLLKFSELDGQDRYSHCNYLSNCSKEQFNSYIEWLTLINKNYNMIKINHETINMILNKIAMADKLEKKMPGNLVYYYHKPFGNFRPILYMNMTWAESQSLLLYIGEWVRRSRKFGWTIMCNITDLSGDLIKDDNKYVFNNFTEVEYRIPFVHDSNKKGINNI